MDKICSRPEDTSLIEETSKDKNLNDDLNETRSTNDGNETYSQLSASYEEENRAQLSPAVLTCVSGSRHVLAPETEECSSETQVIPETQNFVSESPNVRDESDKDKTLSSTNSEKNASSSAPKKVVAKPKKVK